MSIKNFLLTLIVLLISVSSNAGYYDVEIDGIYYKLNTEAKQAIVVMGCTEYNDYTMSPVRVQCYSGDVVIPNSISHEGIIYSVTAIEGVLREGGSYTPRLGAFEGCSELTSITIPQSITEIGNRAFYGCSSLTAVYIESLSQWCKMNYTVRGADPEVQPQSNPLYYAHDLYITDNNGGKTKVTELVIPENVESINKCTFIGGSFTSVKFHKNITFLDEMSFDYCDNLKDVYFYGPEPKSYYIFQDSNSKTLHVRKRFYTEGSVDIMWNRFGTVEYIEGIDFNLIYKVDGEEYKSSIMEVGETITPEAEPTKEGYTFSGWSEIPETMPDHDLTIIGSFSPNTYKITYTVDGEEFKVVEVKCDEAITPEPNPTRKGMTFSGWNEIPKKMPAKDVTVTGTFSWSKITKDEIVYQVVDTLNNYSTVIGNENANGKITITSDIEFDFIYKVTSIEDKAFNGCKGITTIDIPATITTIGERAFANIDKLTDVTIYAENVPETNRTAFENSYVGYVTLHVPYGSVDKYKAVGPWKDFKEIVPIEGTEPVNVETCAIPTIEFVIGKLVFESDTEGAECHYEIKIEDAKEGVGSEVTLSSAYEITVYASKEGYNDSEKNKATLYWVNVDPISTGIIDNEMRVNTNAILVQNNGSSISLSGLGEGADVMIYNISGQLIGQGKATGNRAVIDTNLSSGDICIIKIGDKSVKYFLR